MITFWRGRERARGETVSNRDETMRERVQFLGLNQIRNENKFVYIMEEIN